MARCPTCHRRLVSGQSCVEHGAIATAQSTAHSDNTAPEWSEPLGECIGSGGFAAVWKIVSGGVLKVAHANHELSRARLFREAEALGAVGAPAVPQLIGHGTLADGRAWIAMEKIAGVNLADLISQGPMRVDHVVALSIKILDALEMIHAAGFAHRDLKPDNIVRRPDGSIVILDLGLARKLPEDPDDPNRAGVQIGSIEYMAPEQVLDATTAGAPADLYAFGCILYELCSGRPPFVGDAAALERAHAALRPPPLGAVAKVPLTLEQLCHDCLAKQPPRRPASAKEVAIKLREVGDATAPGARQHSMSVVREGTQPVVLVWAELPRVDRMLLGTLAARKIAVVSQRGRKVLGGVIGAEHADPAGAAIAAARDLAAAGARVALHLDAVLVKPGPSGVTLVGASVDRPEQWLPPGTWTGVVLTRALATVTQVPTRASDVGPGFALLGDAGHTAELFGRDILITDLAADAAAALAGTGRSQGLPPPLPAKPAGFPLGPALSLLVGDHGIGKTAIGTALAPLLVELGARVHIAALPPPGSGRPGHSALAEITGPIQGPIVRSVGDALRAAARQRPTAVILDDLHLAEHELLDALEYATLGGEPLPLWILGIAAPRLDQRRPGFGSRAERRRRDVLPPLDEDAAVAMTAALLRPAEYPPLRALRQIASIARGNPMHLATLAREIHDRGAIRTRPNGEHFLDTTALDALPPIALGPWLAARELAHISVELVALARVCAVLGDEIERAELAAIVDTVERRGGATTTVDVDIGLAELVSASILNTAGARWTFRQALLQEGVYATTNQLERHALHVAALEYWRTKPQTDPAVADRVARHAEAVGERRTAAAAFSTLGQRAHDEHRALDADQAWQGAVRNLDDRDLDRARALLGRARARYRLQRVRDALTDLDETLAIAAELADPLLEIEALLEKATALDWSDDFESSALVAQSVRALLPHTASSELVVDLDLAEGRSLFRAQKFAQAAKQLRVVMTEAGALERHDSEIVGGLLLAPSLVEVGELDEAQAVFSTVIKYCEDRGDRLHLGAAYANRAWLWSKRGEVEQTASDLRLVIQIAREAGQATLERIGTYNLAEDRLWQGELQEALQLARRSLSIQRGHGEGDLKLDQLLLARVLAALNERDELGTVLAALRDAILTESEQPIVAVLDCVRDSSPIESWQQPLAAGESLPDELRLELAHLAIRFGALPQTLRDDLRALATRHPIWARRSEL